MDTSQEYVRMCEKATEIQPPAEISVDRTNHANFWQRSPDGDAYHYIWLPRQDQLQELVGGDKYSTFYELVESLSSYEMLDQSPYNPFSDIQPSMEIVWLAFVMHQKYGKRWDGADWVKE